MANNSNKLNEANKFLEAGHKFMKTSLLKWAPDHDNAAYQYMQAAMAFKGAGNHQKSIEANDLAIKSFLQSSSTGFQAAKCMEQVALSYKELGDLQSALKYYKRAIDIYRSSGLLDTAITTLDRAAKTITEKMPTLAADLYIQASEVCAIEDRFRQAAEFCQKAALLYVRSQEYQRAVNITKEEYKCYSQVSDMRHTNRIAMCLILIYLADNNIVGAHEVPKCYQMDGDTSYLAHNLIKGFEKRDSRLVNSTLTNGFFRNLDNEYAKIARNILNLYGQIKESSNSQNETAPEQPQEEDILL